MHLESPSSRQLVPLSKKHTSKRSELCEAHTSARASNPRSMLNIRGRKCKDAAQNPPTSRPHHKIWFSPTSRYTFCAFPFTHDAGDLPIPYRSSCWGVGQLGGGATIVRIVLLHWVKVRSLFEGKHLRVVQRRHHRQLLAVSRQVTVSQNGTWFSLSL
jgi:hypothetical protein